MTGWTRPGKEELKAIAEGVLRGEPYIPPYQGRYFAKRPVEFTPPLRHPDPCMFEGHIGNLPTDEKIAEVLAFDPRAADLMGVWRRSFDLSFPNWTDGSVFPNFQNETSKVEHAMRLIEQDIEKHETAPSYSDYLVLEIHLNWLRPDRRDYRLHAIDDAEVIRSLGELPSGQGTIFLGNHRLIYVGKSDDGTPLLAFASGESHKRPPTRESANPYWTWDFFQEHMRRESVTVVGDSDLSWTLCDMASQGHRKAFLKNCESKGGTWTINLDGVRFLRDAEMRVRSTIYPHNLSMKAMVQEHLPFTHEQRFFVVNGRVVASVCSDRTFSTLDQVKGKRLDHRLATLHTPEIEHGEFDRGVTSNVSDRRLSAQFARFARRIASEAREQGILDYVVDIGITARGPAAIEVNELELSGPYSLDRGWVTKAYARRSKNQQVTTQAEAA